jgi:hypothetical protein
MVEWATGADLHKPVELVVRSCPTLTALGWTGN